MSKKLWLITYHLKRHDGQSAVAMKLLEYISKNLHGIEGNLLTFTNDKELIKELENKNLSVINLGNDSAWFLGLDLILDYNAKKIQKIVKDEIEKIKQS